MNTGDGERGRNRTFNLLIKSQLLCQLSYAPEKGGGRLLAPSSATTWNPAENPARGGIRQPGHKQLFTVYQGICHAVWHALGKE